MTKRIGKRLLPPVDLYTDVRQRRFFFALLCPFGHLSGPVLLSGVFIKQTFFGVAKWLYQGVNVADSSSFRQMAAGDKINLVSSVA